MVKLNSNEPISLKISIQVHWNDKNWEQTYILLTELDATTVIYNNDRVDFPSIYALRTKHAGNESKGKNEDP